MSIWQTQTWQDMLIASGQSEEYFVIEKNIMSPDSLESGLEGAIFIEKRKVSLGEYGLFVIGFEGELGIDTQENLQELCKEENCLFIQVETIDYFTASSPLAGENGERCLEGDWKRGAYKKFIPSYTCVIDLSQNEDDILAKMKPKGRYNIRLAAKKGVSVKSVEKTDENIKIFYELVKQTTTRDKFAGNTMQYYKTFLDSIEDSELMFTYFEGRVIASGIFVFGKEEALYYYGASGNTHRNLMAPYVLQWEVIRKAKEKACKIYDFLGIASPGEKNSPLTGVTDFKKKLSKDIREVSHSQIWMNKKIKYFFIQILKSIRK